MRCFLMLGSWVLVACGGMGLEQKVGVSVLGAVVEVYPQGDIAFGDVSPYASAEQQTLIFRGVGDASGVVQKIFFEDDDGVFDVVDNPAPFRLDVDESRTLEVSFSPETRKQYNVTMLVEIRGDSTAWMERRVVGNGCKDDNHDGRCEQSGPPAPSFDSVDTGGD